VEDAGTIQVPKVWQWATIVIVPGTLRLSGGREMLDESVLEVNADLLPDVFVPQRWSGCELLIPHDDSVVLVKLSRALPRKHGRLPGVGGTVQLRRLGVDRLRIRTGTLSAASLSRLARSGLLDRLCPKPDQDDDDPD
jgi:hypothetical protein